MHNNKCQALLYLPTGRNKYDFFSSCHCELMSKFWSCIYSWRCSMGLSARLGKNVEINNAKEMAFTTPIKNIVLQLTMKTL